MHYGRGPNTETSNKVKIDKLKEITKNSIAAKSDGSPKRPVHQITKLQKYPDSESDSEDQTSTQEMDTIGTTNWENINNSRPVTEKDWGVWKRLS